MRRSVSTFRVLSLAVLALGVTVATTGCFKRGAKGDYALAPEMRPLEVPPDLTAPAGAVTAGATSTDTVLASQVARPAPAGAGTPAASASGFTLPGAKDAVYAQVGTALEGVEGVTIASRAQLLGSYDVAYEGSNFLVRVVAVEAGSYVSAVDPRGVAATDAAPVKLMGELKAKLAQ